MFYNLNDPCVLGGVKRHLRRARQLYVLCVTRQNPKIRKKQAGLYVAQAGAP